MAQNEYKITLLQLVMTWIHKLVPLFYRALCLKRKENANNAKYVLKNYAKFKENGIDPLQAYYRMGYIL